MHSFEMSAQRLALLAPGWAWILSGSRENSKPEKCLKTRQNPRRPVHAVLGGFYHQKTSPFADVSLDIIVSPLRSFEWKLSPLGNPSWNHLPLLVT